MMDKELLEKIRVGDGITDDELDRALVFFRHLEASLKLMGTVFHHAWFDVFSTLNRLEGFKSAREERKKPGKTLTA